MSNTLANKRYVEQLEAEQKKLKQEKTAAEALATLADERMKAAYSAKDDLLNQKSQIQEQLAVCQVEKTALEEQSQRTERRLQDENTQLQASVQKGVDAARDLQAQLDRLAEQKAQLEAQVAVAASERRGTDEASRRSEQLLSRFQQDFPALQARCDAAEEQSKDLRLARQAASDEIAQLKVSVWRARERERERRGRARLLVCCCPCCFYFFRPCVTTGARTSCASSHVLSSSRSVRWPR